MSLGTAQQKQNDEVTLIAAILAGDSHFYHELIRPYERTVFMTALSLMKNEADAEEVAQEAFLKAFRNISTFRAESKFGTWLISIVLNEARARLRRQAIVPMESLDDTSDEGAGVSPALLRDWREIPLQVVEQKEIRAMLQSAVLSLPDIYRQVFLLRDVEELSVAETAEALAISVASVKVRLHRARLLLQKQLSPILKKTQPTQKRRWIPWS
jgi:RNA polymerase sigma-70 factor (ECF subfamily)